MNGPIVRVATIALLASASGFAAQADRLSLSAGGNFSIGDYGDPEDTRVWYESLSARYSTGPIAFRVTVPFLQIDGPATVTDDGEVGGGGASRIESGIGDVSLSATYTLSWKPEKMSLDLTGRVRLPTGDEDRGLGTGETDYTLLANLDKDFDSVKVFVEAGRRFLGSSPTNQRQDGWIAGAGLSTDLSKETEIGASLSWREAAFDTNDDPASVSAFVRQTLTNDLSLRANVMAGLSDGSPNFGTGLSLTWTVYRGD
jgi:hypothetical protein